MKNSLPLVSVVSTDAAATDGKQNGIFATPPKQASWVSRNKWLISGIAILVVAVIAISVSVTSIDNSTKSRTPVRAANPTSAQASASEVVQLPPPNEWDPTQWEGPVVDYYKALNDSLLLTPENIKGFIAVARQILQEKFNVTLAEHLGSPKTILHYLQASRQWDIIEAILNWAQGKDLLSLKFDDLINLVDQLKAAFNQDRLFEFNRAMSVAHEHVAKKMKGAEGEQMSMNDLISNFTAAGFDMTDVEQQIGQERQFSAAKKGPAKTVAKPPAKAPVGKAPVPPTKPAPKAPVPATPAPTPRAPAPKPATPAPAPKGKFEFKNSVVPMVFHVLQYKSVSGGKTVALPPSFDAAKAAANLVTEVNKLFQKYGTKVSTRVGEVRSDVAKYPYLLQDSLLEWQKLAADGVQEKGIPWLEKNNAPVDQFVNVYVAGSFNIPQAPCMSMDGVDCGRGYAWVAPIGSCGGTEGQKWQHVFIMHDEFSLAWFNKNWGGYTPGAIVLAHELAHHLGLLHTHNGPSRSPYGCSQPNDEIGDTNENDDAQTQPWWDQADNLCQDALDGKAASFSASAAKFDSCPKAAGYDAITNIMSYSPDSCRSFGNGGITPQQVAYMQLKMVQCRPKLYACISGANPQCYH